MPKISAISKTVQKPESKLASSKFKEFLDSCSCHGLYQIRHSDSLIGKALWSLIFGLAFVGLIVVMMTITHDFVTSPTATYISIDEKSSMKFPEILICPKTLLNRTMLKTHNISIELARYTQQVYPKVIPSGIHRLQPEYDKLIDRYENRDIRKFFHEFGPSCAGTFEQCSFNAIQFNCCESEVIREVGSGLSGKCFLVQIKQEQSWPMFGLAVSFKLDYKELLPIDDSAMYGVSVQINQKFTPTDLTEIYILGGVHTFIQMETEVREYQNTFLKTTCNDSKEAKSMKHCEWRCQQFINLEDWGCGDPAPADVFPDITNAYPGQNGTFFPICSPKNLWGLLENNDNYHENPRLTDCLERCMPPCRSQDYLTSISISRNPATNHPVSHYDVSIYFGKFRVTKTQQFQTMTFVSVIANLGGAMGVFLGASLITVIEFLVFCLEMLTVKFKPQLESIDCK